MPTITVMAPDSALAMDEVIRQLGDGAYILSTSQKDGMIQIKATNEPATSAPKRLSSVKTVFEDELERQFSGAQKTALVAALGGADVAIPVGPASKAERPTLVSVDGGLMEKVDVRSAAHSMPTPKDELTGNKGSLAEPESGAVVFSSTRTEAEGSSAPEHAKDQPTSPEEVIQQSAYARDATEGQGVTSKLGEIGDRLQRLEASLGLPKLPPVILTKEPATYSGQDFTKAGMSDAIVHRVVSQLSDRGVTPTTLELAHALASEMVGPSGGTALDADLLFVVGSSGSGKTTLAAKFAALMRETRENRTVSLVSLEDNQTPSIDLLSSLGRLINVPTTRWMIDQVEAWGTPRDGETTIVDLACSQNKLAQIWPDVVAHFAGKRCHVVLALGSGLSSGRISDALEASAILEPEVVLTKLDEFECALPELSTIVDNDARIGWLAGTRSLVGNLAQATSPIMEQYLQGCLASPDANGPEADTERMQ